MSAQLSYNIDLVELSCISLNDELDDNENCVAHSSTSEATVVRLTNNSFEHNVQEKCTPEQLERGNSDPGLVRELNIGVESCPPRLSSTQVTSRSAAEGAQRRRSSTFDDLLFEIYDRWHYGWRGAEGLDSDTYTDVTAESDAFVGRSGDSILLNGGIDGDNKCHLSRVVVESKEFYTLAMYWGPVFHFEIANRFHPNLFYSRFRTCHFYVSNYLPKDVSELKQMVVELRSCISQLSSSLVRQLKRRDRRLAAVNSNCDIITAILQASSLKRSVDSKIRFSIEPLPGVDSFEKWKGGMKAVSGLPMGIPTIFRKKVWLALSDNYLHSLCIDWDKTKRFAFNEKSNPDDNKLGLQIVKDLHRTGCTGFSGHDNDDQRAMLKRVLLAYARWNKQVGYCQGFNIIAAFILDVMGRREDCALKVMIYLIDHVLPDGYFGNNLRALSVDMAVFRDLLGSHLPQLSRHLNHMQAAAKDQSTGASYEPPLTNVFTMQWFLTMFATCLPKATALRVWDAILLEGSEILLRTSVAIWSLLEERILLIDSADNFYSSMAELTQEMVDGTVIPADDLIKKIYSMATLPMPMLNELREKYTYNITPFSAPASLEQIRPKTKKKERENDHDHEIAEHSTDSNEPPRQHLVGAGPGAYAAHPEVFSVDMAACSERASLDIDMLSRRYKRIKEKQQQSHVILAVANNKERGLQRSQRTTASQRLSTSVAPIETSAVVNHLFISSDLCLKNRNRAVVRAPTIAASFYDINTRLDRKRSVSVSTVSSNSTNQSIHLANNNNNNIIGIDEQCSTTSLSGDREPRSVQKNCEKGSGDEAKRLSSDHIGHEVVNDRTRIISKTLRSFTPLPKHHFNEQHSRRGPPTDEIISDRRRSNAQ